jgi:hypothetical protein
MPFPEELNSSELEDGTTELLLPSEGEFLDFTCEEDDELEDFMGWESNWQAEGTGLTFIFAHFQNMTRR